MTDTDRFRDALDYARDLHRGQVRKGHGIPYVTHVVTVAGMVGANGGDDVQVVAALLHDALEDGDDPEAIRADIRDRFGDDVLAIVETLTDATRHTDANWSDRKRAYLDELADLAPDDPARLVALADKLHNARAILRDYRRQGDDLWDQFRAGRGGVRWYYTELADILAADRDDWLADELTRTVDALEHELDRQERKQRPEA